jgi:hypothetical protein
MKSRNPRKDAETKKVGLCLMEQVHQTQPDLVSHPRPANAAAYRRPRGVSTFSPVTT